MALIQLPSPMWFPSPPRLEVASSTPGFRSNLVDADGEYAGVYFEVPEVDDGKAIQYIWWRTATVTTGGDLDVRLETVATDGHPSGTLATANSNLVVAVLSGDDDTAFFSTLTATHTVAAGDQLCAIIKRPGGSAFVGNLAKWRRGLLGYHAPYLVFNTGVNGKGHLGSEPPCLTIGYSDGSYLQAPGVYPVDNLGQVVFNSASANAEVGLEFQVPFPCRVIGAWLVGGGNAAGADFQVNLYAEATAPQGATLAEAVVDGEHQAVDNLAAASTRMFKSGATLVKDTIYRLTVEATTANNCKVSFMGVDVAARLLAFPGGANFTWTEDNGGGGWNDNPTRVPIMGLLVDQLDNGAGGAGGTPRLLSPGMIG